MLKRLTVALLTCMTLNSCMKHVDPTPDFTVESTRAFLSLCSGLEIVSDAVETLATANCLGRTRGFIDGHMLTARMQTPSSEPPVQLWCVEASVTDRELLDSVIDWTMKHPDTANTIISKMSGINAATAITIVAVNQAYPCRKNP